MLSSHNGPVVRTPQAAFSTAIFASLYFALDDAGISMVVATPAGGQPATTRVAAISTVAAMPDRFRRDTRARDIFADTLMIEQVFAADFDAMIAVAATDGLWDLVENDCAARIVDQLARLGRPVVLAGHAVAILSCSSLAVSPVRGRRITGASKEEDHIACPDVRLPLHVHDKLLAMGSHYVSGPPWQPFVTEHDKLIAGQNMASVEPAVNVLLRFL
jgi:hypothetical protein